MSNTHKALILALVAFLILTIVSAVWTPDKVLTAKELFATLAAISYGILVCPLITPKKKD